MAYKVPAELVVACRRAAMPTSRSPSSENATTDGVVRAPSLFSITRAVLPSMTATHELVVPKSMPMTSPVTFSRPRVEEENGAAQHGRVSVVDCTGREREETETGEEGGKVRDGNTKERGEEREGEPGGCVCVWSGVEMRTSDGRPAG